VAIQFSAFLTNFSITKHGLHHCTFTLYNGTLYTSQTCECSADNMKVHRYAIHRPVLCIGLLSLECILGPHSLRVNKFTLPWKNVSAEHQQINFSHFLANKG